MKNLSLFGILMTLAAAFLWGTAGTAQSFAQGGSAPYWIGAFRLWVAMLFFHGLYFFYRRPLIIKQTPSYSRHYWLSIGIAGFCMGLYNLSFFAGISATGIAIGTITTIGSAPIWAGIMQSCLLKRAPSLLWWVGTGCATLGGSVMIFAQNTYWQLDTLGLILCLFAGFCYALYTLMSKSVVNIAPAFLITKHIFTIAALIATPLAYLLAGVPTITSTSAWVILYLGFLTTGIAYLLYTYALKYISAATGVALALTEPIVAFVLAITIAGESLSYLALSGLFFILLGLWCILRTEQQNVSLITS